MLSRLRATKFFTSTSWLKCISTTPRLGSFKDDDENTNYTLQRIRREKEADKRDLQWRTPVGDRPEDWNSKLKVFDDPDQNSDFIIMMQQPLDLNPKALAAWYELKKERTERHMQQYVPERHQLLGPDLAAAHFLLYRGATVRFTFDKKWMRSTKNGEFDLPRKYNPTYKVEAIRCDNMTLYYEGLENIRSLQHLKFLSFHNVKTFDDWCLDRVSGSQFSALEVLDISHTKCTLNGLSCLYRIPTLKLLIVTDAKQNLKYELTCAMLEEVIPNLKIVSADSIHNSNESNAEIFE